MKMEKWYSYQVSDSSNDQAAKVESELAWVQNEIARGYDKIMALRKEMFYKEQLLKSIFKSRCGVFNSVCRIPFIIDAFEGGLFNPKTLDSKEKKDASKAFLVDFVANFFPNWMWKNLEFFEVSQEGYDARAIEPAFIWSTGKGKAKKELEFRIRIPNPKNIKEHELFEVSKLDDAASEACKVALLGVETFKTVVHVNTDVKRGDWRCTTYDFVGEGYFNDTIRDAIDEWMDKNGYKKGQK